MTNVKEFNPIETARKVEDSYREYIATTIHFDDADLQRQLETILCEPGYLAKGPFLEAAPPYRKDKTVADLVDEGVLCKGMMSLGGGEARNFNPIVPYMCIRLRPLKKALPDEITPLSRVRVRERLNASCFRFSMTFSRNSKRAGALLASVP